MPVYKWKQQAGIPVDPQVAGERLEELSAVHGGLTPALIVDDARPEEAPLHAAFEWDDSEAAELYRLDQARHVLRSIVVPIERPDAEPFTTRAFVVIRSAGDRTYNPIHTVLADEDMSRQLIERALRELREWLDRYSGYVELTGLHGSIRRAIGTFREQLDVQ